MSGDVGTMLAELVVVREHGLDAQQKHDGRRWITSLRGDGRHHFVDVDEMVTGTASTAS
jgi:hypothetical protein